MSEPSPPLFEVSNALVQRQSRTILRVDGLRLDEGEHVALLGPNGSGKSTLIGLLTREVFPLALEGTSVRFHGDDRPSLFDVRTSIGLVSSDLQDLHRRPFTVTEVVVSGYFGSIGLNPVLHPTAKMISHAHEAMEELGIAALAERRMHTLSTGEARRALIARALVHDPDVLVLDEPCDGLDPSATYHVLGMISAIARSGRSVVLVTHHVEDVVPEIERTILLDGGTIVADGPKGTVIGSENISTVYGIPIRVEERDGWYRLWYESWA